MRTLQNTQVHSAVELQRGASCALISSLKRAHLLFAQWAQPHLAAAAAQAAIVSVVVLLVLTPICVAILAGLAAARDALSGPTRQSKIAGPAAADGNDGGGTIAAMVWPGPDLVLVPV